jgi:hypothetical protein
MRRLWYIATILLAAFPISATAQMRGGMHAPARVAPRAGGGPRGMPAPRMGWAGRGNTVFFGQPFFHHHFCNSPFCTSPFFFHRRFFSPYAYSYPYAYSPLLYAYPYLYDDSFGTVYSGANGYYGEERNQPASPDYAIEELGRKIDRLSDAIAELRNEQYRSSQPAANPRQEQPATVLVFKDHHTETVRDYAVIGHTLWALSEGQARKIPLANLDLSATQKTNEERGIFPHLPGLTPH